MDGLFWPISCCFTVFFVGLFVLACLIRWLFFPSSGQWKNYVTHDELKYALADLKTDISKKIDEMSDYAHKIAHEQSNFLHGLGLKIERLVTLKDVEDRDERNKAKAAQKQAT